MNCFDYISNWKRFELESKTELEWLQFQFCSNFTFVLLQACFLPLSDASSFLVLYIVTSVYFSGVMVILLPLRSILLYLYIEQYSIFLQDMLFPSKVCCFWSSQVRLMLVLAPAACILSGIALSEAFTVLTWSIKFQLSLSLEVRVLFYYCEMLLTFSVTNVCIGQLVTSAVFYAYSGLTFDIPSEGCFNSQIRSGSKWIEGRVQSNTPWER